MKATPSISISSSRRNNVDAMARKKTYSMNLSIEGTRLLSGQRTQCMDRFIFYSLASFYLCVGVLASPARAMSINRIEDQYLKLHCTTEVSNPIGSIDILPCLHTSLSHRQLFLHQWTMHVPGASNYTIYIEHALPSSSSLGKIPRENSESGEIDIITQGGINVLSWNVQSSPIVLVMESNSVKVIYRGRKIHSQQEISPSKFAFLSYVATVSGSPKEELCSENVNQTIPNGYVTVTNRTLGSRAMVQCNNGYRQVKSYVNKEPMCVVKNGQLMWEYWPGRCIPFCPDPKPIEHGSVQVKDFGAKEGYRFYEKLNSSKITEKKMRYISMATYSCDMPYVLEGETHSLCKLDHKNKPEWTYTPSTCVIPSCSHPITLQEQTGAIVHPNYPHHLSEARPLNCQWRIRLKTSSVIDFNFLFLDIPGCHESYIRYISTTTNSGPRTIATFTNISVARESSFSVSASDDLLVTYQHSPSCHVTGHRGFYIKYAIRPHQRIRREALTQNGQTNSTGSISQKPLAVLTPSGASPTSDTTQSGEESESNSSWKIAVGVVIPLIIIGVILFIVYKIYRKKFPVRMILGREFGKFRNPNYDRPRSGLSLVRGDADDVFSRDATSSVHNPEFQTSEFKISYDNRGFDGDDEVDYENAEDRADREFRLRKSWLFRSKEAEEGGESQPGSSDADEDIDETDDKKTKKKTKHVTNQDDKEFSDDSDIEAMMQEQQVTPRIKRKERSESDSLSSLSENQPEDKPTDNSSSHSVSNSNNEETESQDEMIQSTDRRSSFLQRVGPLFQQPTFEEVRAQMKARARSMSVDKPPPSPRPRSSSVQVDPSKSARRMSYNDSLDSKVKTDLLRFVHMQKITASVVGVAYLDPDGEIGSSMSSVNSNPHLVTDIDANSSGEEGVEQCEVKIMITSDDLEMNDDKTHPETQTVKHEEADETHEIDRESVEEKPSYESTAELSDTERGDGYTSDNVFNDKKQSNYNEISELELNDDDDIASPESTSGSSSSSDTHFEEHHVAMAKPIFSQQVSSVSGSYDPTALNPHEEIKDRIDKGIPNSGEVEMSERETPNQQNDSVTTSQTMNENSDDPTGFVNVKVNNDHAAPYVIETEDSKSKSSDSGASDLERTQSEESDNDVDIDNFHIDPEPAKAQNLDCSSSIELPPPEISVGGHEPKLSQCQPKNSQSIEDVKFDVAPPMGDLDTGHKTLERSLDVEELVIVRTQDVEYYEGEEEKSKQAQNNNLNSQHIEAVANKRQESKSTEDKVNYEKDEIEKNGPESGPTMPVLTEPSREPEIDRTDNGVKDNKKTIGYTPSTEDIDSNSGSPSDSESISVISDHSTGDKEKLERLSSLSVSEDSDTETPSRSVNEKSKEYRAGADFIRRSVPTSSDLSSTGGSGNALVSDRPLRVISGIEFSDASSDSSDVCQDDPPTMAETGEEKGSRAHPALKRISFDVNRYVESFDNSDDDDIDVTSDDGKKDNQRTSALPQVHNEDKKDEVDPLTLAAVTESLLQRDRSSTGCSDDIDAYHEFTDNNIDNILLQTTVDSNSNVTAQRTIGIDPDVTFSFQDESSKTKITFREEESDDDVDV